MIEVRCLLSSQIADELINPVGIAGSQPEVVGPGT